MRRESTRRAALRMLATLAIAVMLAGCGVRTGDAGGDPYGGGAMPAPSKPPDGSGGATNPPPGGERSGQPAAQPGTGGSAGSSGGSAGSSGGNAGSSGGSAGGAGGSAGGAGGSAGGSAGGGGSLSAGTYTIDPQPLPAAVQNVAGTAHATPQAVLVKAEGKRYLIVAAGERPTGGYSVQIRGVRADGGAWVVDAVVQGPPQGAMVTQAITYPKRTIALPDDGKTVRVTLDGGTLPVTESARS